MTNIFVISKPEHTEHVVQAARQADFLPQIHIANDIAETLALLQKQLPDFAVVDCNLTSDEYERGEGFEVIRAIREAAHDCFIISLTADASTAEGARSLSTGANYYIYTKFLQINWYAILREYLQMIKASRAETPDGAAEDLARGRSRKERKYE